MNKIKKLCSVLLIIMLMMTFVLPSAGYAAGADLSILENCSVTLLKDGNFKLTAYCNCAVCCGRWAGGPTASGKMPVQGRTIATGVLPFGTKLNIGGKIYTVEDRGTPYGHIDIYMERHADAEEFGVRYADVYQSEEI